jgi:hypothetical protein
MAIRLHVKYRIRKGVPYSVEQAIGIQFRCRHCNQVYFPERELDKHIKKLLKSEPAEKIKPSPSTPKLNTAIEIRIPYIYDFTDKMRQKWLKLKEGDTYDGI